MIQFIKKYMIQFTQKIDTIHKYHICIWLQSNVTFTMDEAKDKCKEMVEESKAVKTCWETVNKTDFETKLDNCAADLNVSHISIVLIVD